MSVKAKCCILFVLLAVFVTWGAYAVDRAYAQEQQMCRQESAIKLGEEVRQRFYGSACSITIWCADGIGGEEESFTCSINMLLEPIDIGQQIAKVWEEKAAETQRDLCRYMGSQVLFLGKDGCTTLADPNGEYQLTLKQSLQRR